MQTGYDGIAAEVSGCSQPQRRLDMAITSGYIAATSLALLPEHASEICALPPIHKDPFDRALIAQATVEKLTLITTDSEVVEYASQRVRILR
jgi:PIN domain nuclease of toxin-antitoxin system